MCLEFTYVFKIKRDYNLIKYNLTDLITFVYSVVADSRICLRI